MSIASRGGTGCCHDGGLGRDDGGSGGESDGNGMSSVTFCQKYIKKIGGFSSLWCPPSKRSRHCVRQLFSQSPPPPPCRPPCRPSVGQRPLLPYAPPPTPTPVHSPPLLSAPATTGALQPRRHLEDVFSLTSIGGGSPRDSAILMPATPTMPLSRATGNLSGAFLPATMWVLNTHRAFRLCLGSHTP